jgi:DNA-directed RNA polymerase sigma subunit (sigma70/sigma32)
MSVETAHQPLSRTGRRPSDGDSGLEIEDSLSLYFRGVGRTPLLSRVQERELCRRKDAGDDRAKRPSDRSELRLVIWIARQYRHHNVPVLDLIQEGISRSREQSNGSTIGWVFGSRRTPRW